MILITMLFWFIGVFMFSFTLWKRLKEDYTKEQIFTFTFFVCFFCLIGWALAGRLAPDFTLWSVLITGVLTGSFLLKRLEIKFFELIDALVPAAFYFLLFGSVGTLVLSPRERLADHGVPVIIILACLFVFKFFLSRYRRFSWYPSGKVGFAGLLTAGIYFLGISLWTAGRGLTARYGGDMMNFDLPLGLKIGSGIINVIIGTLVASFLFYLIYLRSGRK